MSTADRSHAPASTEGEASDADAPPLSDTGPDGLDRAGVPKDPVDRGAYDETVWTD
jgi:hypothetical protein